MKQHLELALLLVTIFSGVVLLVFYKPYKVLYYGEETSMGHSRKYCRQVQFHSFSLEKAGEYVYIETRLHNMNSNTNKYTDVVLYDRDGNDLHPDISATLIKELDSIEANIKYKIPLK